MTNIKKIIREVIDSYVNRDNIYAKTLQDEELTEGVTYLHRRDTNLSHDIIVDCGKNYEYYNHPLCLYVVYDKNVKPVDLIKDIAKTSSNIPMDIINFIHDNYTTLCAFANMEIDGADFFDIIKDYKQKVNLNLIAEMSNYSPNRTGLPVWVYVDDTNSYLNSGHNGSYRMKFQQDKNVKNPRLWMPIAIPSMEIMDNGKLPHIVIPQKHINLVLYWAKGNLSLLESLRDGKITGAEFKEKMIPITGIEVLTASEDKN